MKKITCLALSLILISTVPLLSQRTSDDIRIKYNNPDLIVDMGVGLWGYPIPVDYDDDGINDIIMSCPDAPFKGVYFFKNIGTNQVPLFDKPVKLDNRAYRNTSASYFKNELHVMRPSLEYVNFKSSLQDKPHKVVVDNLPDNDMVKVRSNMWTYVSFDNGDEPDLMIGIDDWGEYGWDNAYNEKGEWQNGPLRGYVYLFKKIDGKYVNQGKLYADNKPIETYGAPNPQVADFDGDGKPDIICGEFLDKLTFYKNTGTRKKPKFSKKGHLRDERGEVITFHVQMITPVAYDFNRDGHVDLLVGDEDGRVAFVENTGKRRGGIPVFKKPVYLQQKADNLKFGALSTPFAFDWDGDGLDDIISGNSAGNIAFIKNLGMRNGMPKWDAPVLLKAGGEDIRIMAGENGSIQGPCEAKWGYTTLTVADWDNDGLPDIILNSIFGEIIWYKNSGDLQNLRGPFKVKVDWEGKQPPKPSWNWWSPEKNDLVTQWRTTPYAIDLNKDGLVDLVMVDHEGYLAYYERFEKEGELWLKPGKRMFYAEDVSAYDHANKLTGQNPLPLRLNTGEAGRSGRRKLCITDWNGDGKLDLIVNSTNAAFFENVRQTDDAIYFINRGDVSKIRLAGHTTNPAPVDWDKTGKPDLLIGAEDGHFYLIKNNSK